MHTRTYRESPVTVALGRAIFEMMAFGEPPTPHKASWSTIAACADDPPSDGPGDDCPDHGPYGDDECPKCALQTMLAMQQQGLCLNCKGEHRTWACPEVGDILFADIAFGRKLCRLRWRKFPDFVALITSAHASGHLHAYAASYQAFIRSHQPDSDLTIGHVLKAWGRIITPTLEQAA